MPNAVRTLFACAVAFSFAIDAAHAQTATYPGRPVRLVVPFAPGGTNDILGRIVAEKLSEKFGQPFVADNRAGANTVVGSEIVARATPDGHTLLIVSASIAVNPSLVPKLPYDTLRDFAPIGMVAGGPYLMVIHPAVPAKTVGEFIAWVKSQQGKVNYASTGTGGPPHLAAELLKITAGIDMQHIPYKGGGAVLPDLIAGRVSMFFGSIATLRPHVESGRLRAVGMTTAQRSSAMPDVPTFIESGLVGYEMNGWYGLLTTGKTPRAIVERLSATLRQILNDAETRAQFIKNGLDPLPGSADEFAHLLSAEIVKWASVVKAVGIKAE
ncbi:MAG: tripartite tricarboxylate transporter substrate binding protein [Betaproteobacteria bacterium]